MPKKTKKQLNAEFLEKIKTITFAAGSKSSGNAKCVNCGETFDQHIPALVIPIAIPVPSSSRKPKPEAKRNDETAFAA